MTISESLRDDLEAYLANGGPEILELSHGAYTLRLSVSDKPGCRKFDLEIDRDGVAHLIGSDVTASVVLGAVTDLDEEKADAADESFVETAERIRETLLNGNRRDARDELRAMRPGRDIAVAGYMVANADGVDEISSVLRLLESADENF